MGPGEKETLVKKKFNLLLQSTFVARIWKLLFNQNGKYSIICYSLSVVQLVSIHFYLTCLSMHVILFVFLCIIFWILPPKLSSISMNSWRNFTGDEIVLYSWSWISNMTRFICQVTDFLVLFNVEDEMKINF